MKQNCKILLAIFLCCLNVARCQSEDPYKTIVTYLGTDFIMQDGCPPPKCDPNLRECRKEMIDLEAEYNKCQE